jgi:DinB superfamily
MTHPETLDKLALAFAETEMAGSSLSEVQFFKRPADGKWSPAENMQHLFLSVKPLVGLFGKPELMEQFGKTSGAGRSYDELVNLYHEKLKTFAASGIVNNVYGLAATQAEQIANLHSIHQKFLERAAALPENILNEYQIPHPLLGLLTVREFLYFTIYHEGHHTQTIKGK